jgi:hypothetical protein
MSGVVTEYRGHKIRWSDNEDCWTCYDLSDKVRASPKLSAIKAAIDRLYLAERKAAGVGCWEISSHDGSRTPATVVEYLGEKTEKSWSGRTPDRIYHKVAVVAKRTASERPARRETSCDQLARLGAEFDAAWEIYANAFAERKAAQKREQEAFGALPRLQVEDIAKLVELAKAGAA